MRIVWKPFVLASVGLFCGLSGSVYADRAADLAGLLADAQAAKKGKGNSTSGPGSAQTLDQEKQSADSLLGAVSNLSAFTQSSGSNLVNNLTSSTSGSGSDSGGDASSSSQIVPPAGLLGAIQQANSRVSTDSTSSNEAADGVVKGFVGNGMSTTAALIQQTTTTAATRLQQQAADLAAQADSDQQDHEPTAIEKAIQDLAKDQPQGRRRSGNSVAFSFAHTGKKLPSAERGAR